MAPNVPFGGFKQSGIGREGRVQRACTHSWKTRRYIFLPVRRARQKGDVMDYDYIVVGAGSADAA